MLDFNKKLSGKLTLLLLVEEEEGSMLVVLGSVGKVPVLIGGGSDFFTKITLRVKDVFLIMVLVSTRTKVTILVLVVLSNLSV